MIKRITARIKDRISRMWSNRNKESGIVSAIMGIVAAVVITVVIISVAGAALVGVVVLLPALFLMWSAGFVHGVWDQVPILSYTESLTGIIGLWVVGWTLGMFLRIFLFTLFGGAK